MWLKEGLRSSELLGDSDLERYLFNYFPTRIQSDFRNDILTHPLRRDIISNEIVGEMTLAVGISFIPTIVASQNISIPNAMKCLLASDAILQAGPLRHRLRELDTVENCQGFTGICLDMATALRAATSWLSQSHDSSIPLRQLIALYAESFSALIPYASAVFSGEELRRHNERVAEYLAAGTSEEDAIMLSLFRRVYVVLEVLWCAREYKQDVQVVAKVLSHAFEALDLGPIFKFERSIQSNNVWERELAEGAYHEIRRALSVLAGKLIHQSHTSSAAVASEISKYNQSQAIASIIFDVREGLRTKRPFTISVLPLVARHLRALTEVV